MRVGTSCLLLCASVLCVCLEGSRARDDYQPCSLGSCFLSADVAPAIQLAWPLSDCLPYSVLVGQPCSVAAQQRHPVEEQYSAGGRRTDAYPAAAPEEACETEHGWQDTEIVFLSSQRLVLAIICQKPFLIIEMP